MKKFLVLSCAVLMVFGLTTMASATRLDFEDLTTSAHGDALPDGYAGFTWGEFLTQDNASPWQVMHDTATNFPDDPDGLYYLKGTMDGGNAGDRTKISFFGAAAVTVSLDSISFGRKNVDSSVWATSLIIQANLLDGSNLQETVTFTGWVTLVADDLFGDRDDIKSLVFIQNGNGERFLIDDLEYTASAAVPEPGTLLLLGGGLVVLAGLGRKKFFRKCG